MKRGPIQLTDDLIERITVDDLKMFITPQMKAVAEFSEFDWRIAENKSEYFLDYRKRLWAHMQKHTQLYEPYITKLKSITSQTIPGRPIAEAAKATVKENLQAKGQQAAAMEGAVAKAKSTGGGTVAATAAKEADYAAETLRNLKDAHRAASAKATATAIKKKLLTREGISETLSKKNAEKLAGWAKARPAWMKLAVGTGLAIGAIGVINRVAVGNHHPPEDVERAWARIERAQGRMAKQRRQDWSDFGSPWGGKTGKALISAIGGAAERAWAKRGLEFRSVDKMMRRAFLRERVKDFSFDTKLGVQTIVNRLAPKPGPISNPIQLTIPGPLRTGPLELERKIVNLPTKSRVTQVATNHPERSSPGLVAWNRKQRHYYARADKDSHLFGGQPWLT